MPTNRAESVVGVTLRVKSNRAMHKYQVLLQIGENGDGDIYNIGANTRIKSSGRKCFYDLFKRFREGKETVDDDPRLDVHIIIVFFVLAFNNPPYSREQASFCCLAF